MHADSELALQHAHLLDVLLTLISKHELINVSIYVGICGDDVCALMFMLT